MRDFEGHETLSKHRKTFHARFFNKKKLENGGASQKFHDGSNSSGKRAFFVECLNLLTK